MTKWRVSAGLGPHAAFIKSRLPGWIRHSRVVDVQRLKQGLLARPRAEDAQAPLWLREALAGWRHSISEWKLQKEFLFTQKVTTPQINWFVEQFIPEPHATQTTDRVKDNIEVARTELLMELFGGLNQGIQSTSLGLFEAASSWNEHVRAAQTPLSRFKRAVLSPTDVLFQARELAVAAASV